MVTRESIQEKRDAILKIARLHGASDIRIFGSVAHGDATENSDIDFVVRFDPDRSLFDHGGLIVDLEELLGVKVDVVSEAGMRPRFRDQVMAEVIPL
jgi:hypothetical protein